MYAGKGSNATNSTPVIGFCESIVVGRVPSLHLDTSIFGLAK